MRSRTHAKQMIGKNIYFSYQGSFIKDVGVGRRPRPCPRITVPFKFHRSDRLATKLNPAVTAWNLIFQV